MTTKNYNAERYKLHKLHSDKDWNKSPNETDAEFLARRYRNNRKSNRKRYLEKKLQEVLPKKSNANSVPKYCTKCGEIRERRYFPKVGRLWGSVCFVCKFTRKGRRVDD